MNTTPGAVDWLAQFTQDLTNLTTQNGGALSNFGMILLTFIATMILIGIAVRMSSWSVHFGGHRTVSLDELRTFLFRFLFCLVRGALLGEQSPRCELRLQSHVLLHRRRYLTDS